MGERNILMWITIWIISIGMITIAIVSAFSHHNIDFLSKIASGDSILGIIAITILHTHKKGKDT